MKKHVVTASVLAGLSMISGAAFAQTGSVGANFTKIDTDFGDADNYGIDGEVIFDVGGGWAGIVEGSFVDSDDADSTIGAKGHMINRGSNNAWGGFVGLADSDGSNLLSVGGEYAHFFDASTLAANLTYSTDDDADVDLTALNGAYRIFASDNLRFDIAATLGRAESGGVDADVNAIGVGAEYRFDASPFSVGASYTRADGDIAEADIFAVSFRWNFGDTTLKAADRAGKTFTGLGTAGQPF
jgi:hypothetical protein